MRFLLSCFFSFFGSGKSKAFGFSLLLVVGRSRSSAQSVLDVLALQACDDGALGVVACEPYPDRTERLIAAHADGRFVESELTTERLT
jgi:hypothetical protein